MASAANLRIVPTEPVPEPTPAEKLLAELVPTMIRAEQMVSRLKGMVDLQRRDLAAERGVAFIREEAVRHEFGRIA